MQNKSKISLILLDRDGVINKDTPDFIKTPAEWIPIPKSLESIAKLNHHGYTVAVCSNQSGIARKLYTWDSLNQINKKMQSELNKVGGKIDHIFICPHHPDENCECRKPKPGLLYQASRHYNTELKAVYMVGDSLKDIQAAKTAGAKPTFVLTGYNKINKSEIVDVPVYKDLASFVDHITKSS